MYNDSYNGIWRRASESCSWDSSIGALISSESSRSDAKLETDFLQTNTPTNKHARHTNAQPKDDTSSGAAGVQWCNARGGSARIAD